MMLVHLIHGQKTRIDDHPIAAQIQQILDRRALLFGAVFAVRQEQLTALLLKNPRRVQQQFAEVAAGIQGVGHHQAQGLGAFSRQVARQQIRAVAALFNGLKHPIFVLLADVAVAGQHAGHRRF